MRTTTRFQIPWLAAGVLVLATACMTVEEERIAPTEVALTASSAAAVGGTPKTLEIRGRLFPKKDGLCELDLRISNANPAYEYALDGKSGYLQTNQLPSPQGRIDWSLLYTRDFWEVELEGAVVEAFDKSVLVSSELITPEMINNRCFTPSAP